MVIRAWRRSIQRSFSMTITGLELLRDLEVEEAGNKKSNKATVVL